MGNFGLFVLEYRAYPLWLKMLLPLSGTILMVSLIMQMVLFPDNPVFLRNGEYVGKYGAIHTREEYEMFLWINRAILLSGLAFFGAFLSTLYYARQASGDKGGQNQPN